MLEQVFSHIGSTSSVYFSSSYSCFGGLKKMYMRYGNIEKESIFNITLYLLPLHVYLMYHSLSQLFTPNPYGNENCEAGELRKDVSGYLPQFQQRKDIF